MLKLYPFQQEFLKDHSRFRIVNKSRQIGVTTALALEIATDALSKKNHLALCVSASERQAMNVLRYVYEQIRPLSPRFREETKTSFTLQNGSSVYSLPNNASTVRGFPADAIYLDEYAHFQDDAAMWGAILPSVSRGGNVTVVSTPLGKRGEFWRLWSEDTRFSKHLYDWTACPDLQIEDIRGRMDPLTFSQEYECAFVDESVSFFPYDLILSAVDDSLTNVATYTGSNPVYLGVDFGKLVDSTVIVAVEKGDPSRVIHIKEFVGVDFSEQFAYLEMIANSLKATRVAVDSTGYGVPLLERAESKLGALVEGVTFTAAIKERMATALHIAFENGAIRIPRNDRLIQQLHTLERSITAAGTVRYRHTAGEHDDFVWSLCLALPELQGYYVDPNDPVFDHEEDDFGLYGEPSDEDDYYDRDGGGGGIIERYSSD